MHKSNITSQVLKLDIPCPCACPTLCSTPHPTLGGTPKPIDQNFPPKRQMPAAMTTVGEVADRHPGRTKSQRASRRAVRLRSEAPGKSVSCFRLSSSLSLSRPFQPAFGAQASLVRTFSATLLSSAITPCLRVPNSAPDPASTHSMPHWNPAIPEPGIPRSGVPPDPSGCDADNAKPFESP